MDLAQNLIFTNIISILIFNASTFHLMMLIESGILLKNLFVVVYAKILHHSFTPTICKNFKSVILLIYCKRKFGNLYASLI